MICGIEKYTYGVDDEVPVTAGPELAAVAEFQPGEGEASQLVVVAILYQYA